MDIRERKRAVLFDLKKAAKAVWTAQEQVNRTGSLEDNEALRSAKLTLERAALTYGCWT